MRDSCIFYRSFFEAIKELPKENQADVYNAIFEHSLNFNEIDLVGINKTIMTLIKPQLDANIKRFENGKKPKQKQNESKTEANNNVNVNNNINANENNNDFLLEKETKGDLLELEILPLNNPKEKRKKVAPKKENETIEATPEFLSLWNQYKEYRVAKKKTFKFAGLQWEQQSFDKFFNLAKGNINTATEILNQTIVNNWDGLFELKEATKQNNNGTTTTNTKQQFKFSTANAIQTITSQTE